MAIVVLYRLAKEKNENKKFNLETAKYVVNDATKPAFMIMQVLDKGGYYIDDSDGYSMDW